MLKKTKKTSGADEKTPSIHQYFSWINNTDEGGTEKQTLINLEYFKWLSDKYGMNIEIYALDEGNIDGPWGEHKHPYESEKTLKQYPNGLGKCAEKAAEFGCRLGIWAGADGFGDTPEEETKRKEMFIGLCRDFNLREIKFDTVCDWLRTEKRPVFKAMVDECRKYVPDLIVLNHRHDFGEASICATTFLLDGLETYIDVHLYNKVSGPHHRMGELSRGLVPGMIRLTEDHGVCISSALDYFEDGLILQAFARSLILAPEIYGNPWLLRDDEQAKLARIYNIHLKYRDILVNGFALPEASYTRNSVSRGDETTRLLTFSNPTWEAKTITLNINGEIGLWGKTGNSYIIKSLHPYECYLGEAEWNDKFDITVEPARTALILVEEKAKFMDNDFVLTGCRYHTIFDKNQNPVKAVIYSADGSVGSIGNKKCSKRIKGDNTIRRPILLGELKENGSPKNTEQLYEATCFASTNDCFEKQAVDRSGPTSVPQVQAARDAFFNQEAYIARGCESSFMFDGRDDTFFDGLSYLYQTKLDGGCLRVDLGRTAYISKIEIKFISFKEEKASANMGIPEIGINVIPPRGTASADLKKWSPILRQRIDTIEERNTPVCIDVFNTMEYYPSYLMSTEYSVGAKVRYIRIPCPMDRIVSFKAYDKEGNELTLQNPKATNLFAPWKENKFKYFKSFKTTVPADARPGAYIAVANDGIHGFEGVYCALEFNGKPVGSTDRASAHRINNWEHITHDNDSGYTYYIPVTDDISGKEVTVHAMFTEKCDVKTNAWLCDNPNETPVRIIDL